MRESRSAILGPRIMAAAFTIMFLAGCMSGPEEVEEEKSRGPAVPVALFDFEVKSPVPGYEALAADVPAALAEAFLKGGAFKPIERAALEKILGEQELALSGLVDPGTAARIGKLLGARFILLGSVAIVGPQARISGRLVDTETAEISWAGSATGELSEIFEVEEELASLVEESFR